MAPRFLTILVLHGLSAPAMAIDFGVIGKAAAIGGRLVLRSPIEEKCKAAGLAGCPELTEGLLLYVEGEKGRAEEKLKLAATINAPEKLRAFATVLAALGEIPAVAKSLGPIMEAARLLSSFSASSPASPQEMRTVERAAPAMLVDRVVAPVPEVLRGPARMVTADTDLSRLLAGVVIPASNPVRLMCGAAGLAWSCVRAVKGPLIVTDLHGISTCKDKVAAVVAAIEGDLGLPRWSISSPAGSLAIHNLRLGVAANEALFIGVPAGSDSPDPRCGVAWSGFVPYETTPFEPRDAPMPGPLVAEVRQAAPTSISDIIAPAPPELKVEAKIEVAPSKAPELIVWTRPAVAREPARPEHVIIARAIDEADSRQVVVTSSMPLVQPPVTPVLAPPQRPAKSSNDRRSDATLSIWTGMGGFAWDEPKAGITGAPNANGTWLIGVELDAYHVTDDVALVWGLLGSFTNMTDSSWRLAPTLSAGARVRLGDHVRTGLALGPTASIATGGGKATGYDTGLGVIATIDAIAAPIGLRFQAAQHWLSRDVSMKSLSAALMLTF